MTQALPTHTQPRSLLLFTATLILWSAALPCAAGEKGTPVTVIGIVAVLTEGDAVVGVTIGTHRVKLDDMGRKVASYKGKKVQASGLLKGEGSQQLLTVTTVAEVTKDE